VLIDMDARTVIAYVMNKMGEGTVGDFRGAAIAAMAYAGIAAS
jgi:hypothetical protein